MFIWSAIEPQKISSKMDSMKRESGESPERSRHCDSWFRADTTGNFWEGALGVDAKVRRPACFLSERVLAEDEIILTWKNPCFKGILRKKVRVKSDVDPAFFMRKF